MTDGRHLIAALVAILATGTAASFAPALGPVLWSGLVVLVALALVGAAIRRELRIRRRLAAIQPAPTPRPAEARR